MWIHLERPHVPDMQIRVQGKKEIVVVRIPIQGSISPSFAGMYLGLGSQKDTCIWLDDVYLAPIIACHMSCFHCLANQGLLNWGDLKVQQLLHTINSPLNQEKGMFFRAVYYYSITIPSLSLLFLSKTLLATLNTWLKFWRRNHYSNLQGGSLFAGSRTKLRFGILWLEYCCTSLHLKNLLWNIYLLIKHYVTIIINTFEEWRGGSG